MITSAMRIGCLRDEQDDKKNWSSNFTGLCLGTAFLILQSREHNGGGMINTTQETTSLTGVFSKPKGDVLDPKGNFRVGFGLLRTLYQTGKMAQVVK